MAYSLDLRERIVEVVAEGKKPPDVAARFKVGVATVRRYLRRSRLGELIVKAPPGRTVLIPNQNKRVFVDEGGLNLAMTRSVAKLRDPVLNG